MAEQKIRVKTKSTYHKFDSQFSVSVDYNKKTKIRHILDEVITFMNEKWSPVKFEIFQICESDSFFHQNSWFDDQSYKVLINQSITEYKKSDIIMNGFKVKVMPNHKYNVSKQEITCKIMSNNNSKDPMNCPIYNSMINKQEYNSNNLYHVQNCHHFENEFTQKPECKQIDNCSSFVRVENGGYNISDLCHLKLYRHPPRTQFLKLQENVKSFIHNKQMEDNTKVYTDTEEDRQKYGFNQQHGFVYALIEETIANGFKYDLCLKCAKTDECKHDVTKSNNNTLLGIVDEKIKDKHHILRGSVLRRGHMLALLMYTGCDCNYDLCCSQRGGDYSKWRWFDYCLYWGIFRLSSAESGSFGVYTGLNNIHLDKKSLDIGFFVTYVSTSWRKEVAEMFMSDKGMIMQFNKTFKDSYRVKCCDVSWISKFKDECEILFARHQKDYWFNEAFKCDVTDESNGIQTVAVYK